MQCTEHSSSENYRLDIMYFSVNVSRPDVKHFEIFWTPNVKNQDSALIHLKDTPPHHPHHSLSLYLGLKSLTAFKHHCLHSVDLCSLLNNHWLHLISSVWLTIFHVMLLLWLFQLFMLCYFYDYFLLHSLHCLQDHQIHFDSWYVNNSW